MRRLLVRQIALLDQFLHVIGNVRDQVTASQREFADGDLGVTVGRKAPTMDFLQAPAETKERVTGVPMIDNKAPLPAPKSTFARHGTKRDHPAVPQGNQPKIVQSVQYG